MILLSVIIIVLVFSGCAPLYVPNTVNAPLLSNKGEMQAAIHLGTAGFDPQLAYAITDNIGVMLNGSFENSKSDSTDDYHKHNFVELGAGYYTKFNENGCFEVYGGYGYGNMQTLVEKTIFNSKLDVQSSRIFIQPAVGLSTNFVDISLASRFVILSAKQNEIRITRSYLEPTLTFKAGPKHIKGVFQVGYSYPLNSIENIDYQPFMLSLGLHLKLNRKYE